MALLIDKGFGLERIAREALIILHGNLNTQLGTVESAYQSLDTTFAQTLKRADRTVKLERVKDDNFILGHRPSLIEAPKDNYPNIAVLATDAIPAPQQGDLDHLHVYQNALAVEIMVKADSADLVNRRIWRTVEAVNTVLMSYRTLNGLVEEIGSTPSVLITDALIRRETRGHGDEWYWQGARIDYDVTKLSTL